MRGFAQRLILKQRQKVTFIYELLKGAFDSFKYHCLPFAVLYSVKDLTDLEDLTELDSTALRRVLGPAYSWFVSW